MMNNKRGKLIKQISLLSKKLEDEQKEVLQHKLYFKRYSRQHSGLLLLAIFIPAFWFGWRASNKKWTSQLAMQIKGIVSLTFFNYLRKQVANLLP